MSLIADPEPRQAVGEALRVGQRMAAEPRIGRGREHLAELDVDGARNVPALVGRAPGTAVEIPAHVGEDDLVPVLGDPGAIDKRWEHRGRL